MSFLRRGVHSAIDACSPTASAKAPTQTTPLGSCCSLKSHQGASADLQHWQYWRQLLLWEMLCVCDQVALGV